MRICFISLLSLAVPGLLAVSKASAPGGRQSNDFSVAPDWEGYRNRLVPEPPPMTHQHFGYRATNHAGGVKAGEIGGWVQRSLTPSLLRQKHPPEDPERQADGFWPFRSHEGRWQQRGVVRMVP